MKRISTSAIAVVTLLVAASMLWPHPASTERHVATTAMPSNQELHIAAGVNKLSADDFDDRSLVFPRQR